MSEMKCKLKRGFDTDGPLAPVPTRSHGAAARLHVRQLAAGPQTGSSGSSVGPPGQPPLLEILLGPAAGDAHPQDCGHGACLLGSDGVPQVIGQQQTHRAVLGPGSGLLGPLSGLYAVQKSRVGPETRQGFALPVY